MKKNEEIKEAMEDLERLSKIKKLRRIAELKEKAIRDEENGLRHAKEEGIAEGRKASKIEIARKLLERNISLEEIQEITSLTKEEIE